MTVSVENGKYTVIQEPDGSLKVLRYGSEWQDLTGNKLVYALAAEIEYLRNLQKAQENNYYKLLDLNDKTTQERDILLLEKQKEECPKCGNEAGYCNCFIYDP